MIVTNNHIIDPARIIYAVKSEAGVRIQIDGAPAVVIDGGKEAAEVWDGLRRGTMTEVNLGSPEPGKKAKTGAVSPR